MAANQAESALDRCRALLHCELARNPHLAPQNMAARSSSQSQDPALNAAVGEVADVSVDAGAGAGVGVGAGADEHVDAGAAAATRARRTAKDIGDSGPNTTGCCWRRARGRSWCAGAVGGRASLHGWSVRAVQAVYGSGCVYADVGGGEGGHGDVIARSWTGARGQIGSMGTRRTIAGGGSGKWECRCGCA